MTYDLIESPNNITDFPPWQVDNLCANLKKTRYIAPVIMHTIYKISADTDQPVSMGKQYVAN
jgi:hypothetical protein